ncbi:MAG: WG repeat-containing protein [Candidatus Heimdallarchaeaceae archaeon]
MDYNKIKVSEDSTHHLRNGKPLYSKRFSHVLKFHSPGLAPVIDATGAYHIKLNGEPAYANRYIQCFGFYYNRAAVITEKGWGHINPLGVLIYEPIYNWVGNFQDEVCIVRSKNGYYFHIDESGNRLYTEDMLYGGDFRNGIAVVRRKNGLCTHIYKDGNFVHDKYFRDLGVYHKGYACAKNEIGWFHINKKGVRIYDEIFSMIEPFYNGYALVEKMNGEKGIINEKGEMIHKIKTSSV